jgi:hypothetical protein
MNFLEFRIMILFSIIKLLHIDFPDIVDAYLENYDLKEEIKPSYE